jgi:hypothetical protein
MKLQPLPTIWIKEIFKRLRGVYGQALMANTWGDDLDDTFKTWAEDLASFKNHPQAIRYALEHLPVDYPPNLLQFKEICQDGIRRIDDSTKKLEQKPTPEDRERYNEALEKIKELVGAKSTFLGS